MQHLPISIVIPTCNRRARLLSLLEQLSRISYPVTETIIVDSGEEKLLPGQYSQFPNLSIRYLDAEQSVCIQRNIGIQAAQSPWILLCDDDIEMPADYLNLLTDHIHQYPETGAASGLWMQLEAGNWVSTYPVRSARTLFWKFIFLQGIWGEIACADNNIVTRKIKSYYRRKGNHISNAGWPVNTDFGGDYCICPVYSLGACLVKREWLLRSPFDEVLDRHGIGDNYGVIAGFPSPFVHIVNNTFVYHYHEPTNRLKNPLQYYRRILALDYFISTKDRLKQVKKHLLIWSLIGNLAGFVYAGRGIMIKATLKAVFKIAFNKNPYAIAKRSRMKIAEPLL